MGSGCKGVVLNTILGRYGFAAFEIGDKPKKNSGDFFKHNTRIGFAIEHKIDKACIDETVSAIKRNPSGIETSTLKPKPAGKIFEYSGEKACPNAVAVKSIQHIHGFNFIRAATLIGNRRKSANPEL